ADLCGGRGGPPARHADDARLAAHTSGAGRGLWTHQRITRARDGSRFSIANIPRLKLEYQLTRYIFFRYVGQYFAQQREALEDPRTSLALVLDPSATARLGPAGGAATNELRSDFLF